MFDAIFPKHWTTLQRLMWLKTNALARAAYEIVTGNPVSFSAKATPLRQLSVAFSPVQSLNGYDAPWPAGGGANKWDEEWEIGGIATSDGSNVSQYTTIRSVNYIPVIGGESYYIKCPSDASAYLFFYDSSKAYIGNSGGYKTEAQTVPSGAAFMRFQMSAAYGATYNHDIAINYPSSVKTYSPYENECPISGWSSLTVYHSGADTSNPQAISINIGQTVYSGYVDVISGVGEVTMAKVTFNGVGQSFSFYQGTQDKARIAWNDFAGIGKIGTRTFLSNVLAASSDYTADPDVWHVSNSGATVARCFIGVPTTITSVEDWRAYCTNNPIDLCYELATPIPIQLTPQEVQSLLGENVMWSDANGDLTVEYRSN